MEKKLFYLLQKDKQLKRQIQILGFLGNQNNSVKISDLKDRIGCSRPTLLLDIQMINDEFTNELSIIVNRENEIVLILKSKLTVSIESITTLMAKNSTVFRVIDAIFHDKLYTYNQAEEKFYISQSTLRSIVYNMNKILESYKISISKKKLTFVGSETDIRLFLFFFYADFQDLFALEKESSFQAETYIEMLAAARDKRLPRLKFSFFRSTIWLMLIKQRLFGKHYVSIDVPFKKEIVDQNGFDHFKEIFESTLYNKMGIRSIPEEESMWAYIVSLHCITYNEFSEQNVDDFVYHREEKKEIIQEILDFVKPFASNIENCKTYYLIESYLINLRLLSMLSPLFAKISMQLQEFIMDTDTYILKKWMFIIDSNYKTSLFSAVFKKDVATTLTLLYLISKPDNIKKKINILFSFQGEPGYDSYLAKNCLLLLEDNDNYSFSFEKITSANIENAEIIVTNYELPINISKECYQVRLSYIPTVNEWVHLKNVIESVKDIK